MEETDERPKGFKVQDRRRFSAEGEPKPGQEDSAEPPSAPAAEPPSPSARPGHSPATDREQMRGEVNFSTFVLSLSTQVLFYLGEVHDPSANAPAPDLDAAQQLIDILGMLQEKTRGNLSGDEAKLLDSMLFDLRMKYVEIARPVTR